MNCVVCAFGSKIAVWDTKKCVACALQVRSKCALVAFARCWGSAGKFSSAHGCSPLELTGQRNTWAWWRRDYDVALHDRDTAKTVASTSWALLFAVHPSNMLSGPPGRE